MAAPATVSGEPDSICHWETGKADRGDDPPARRPALTEKAAASEKARSQLQPFIVGINMSASVSVISKTQSSVRSGVVLQSAFAVMLGIFTVGMVGFSHIEVVHNAAHDVRHSNAFPCH